MILSGQNSWDTRKTVHKIVAKSENPEIGVHVLEKVKDLLDKNFSEGRNLYAFEIEKYTGISLDTVSEYNQDKRVQHLAQDLISELNVAVPHAEYNNPHI